MLFPCEIGGSIFRGRVGQQGDDDIVRGVSNGDPVAGNSQRGRRVLDQNRAMNGMSASQARASEDGYLAPAICRVVEDISRLRRSLDLRALSHHQRAGAQLLDRADANAHDLQFDRRRDQTKDAPVGVEKSGPNLVRARLVVWSRGQGDNELKTLTNEAHVGGTFETKFPGIVERVANYPARGNLERCKGRLQLLGRNRIERLSNGCRTIAPPRAN